MEIIIDKGFLQGFFKHNATPDKRNIYESFIRFVKNLRSGIKVTCDFEDTDELELFIKENPLLNELEDRMPEYKLMPDLHSKIDQFSFYKEGSSMKLFFLENTATAQENLEKHFGYSFIGGHNLAMKWKHFLTDKEITSHLITSNLSIPAEKRFHSWEKFKLYNHPLNAIVIADRFILCDKDLQKLEHNLKPLLRELIPNNKNILPIDVTIISEETKCKQPFEVIKLDLEQYLKEYIPKAIINLTLIDLDDRVKTHLRDKHDTDFHDRRIVTSYYLCESGKGFNLFKKSNQLGPSSSRMYFGFNFYGSNHIDVNFLLNEYAACASIATNVVGSNKNRLLS